MRDIATGSGSTGAIAHVNRWYTFAAYGQSTSASTLYLDATLTAGEVVWNVSAYQIHKFATMYEAQNFMTSRTYVSS